MFKTIIKQYPSGLHYLKMVWDTCPVCNRQRWIRVARQGSRCKNCANTLEGFQRGHNWKGGRYKNQGYIQVWLETNDFFFPMVTQAKSKWGGYVLEHRLVMAKHLGRCLLSWEIVHHKNGVRDDNRIENLQIFDDIRHKQITILENRIKKLEGRIITLEAENAKLHNEILWLYTGTIC